MHVANAITAGSTGSIVVCISPLTTIMIDQQTKFTAMGLEITKKLGSQYSIIDHPITDFANKCRFTVLIKTDVMQARPTIL